MGTSQTSAPLPAVIVGKFSIALTQKNFQALADKSATLVFNEDHLPELAEFLKKVRDIKKSIFDVHKAGKAIAWKECTDWDLAKRQTEADVDEFTRAEKVQFEYTRICQEVETRKQKQEQEKERIQNIKNGIETNALRFASEIANCETSERLTAVERFINLEKTLKNKYQEFLPDAVIRFNELNSILAKQKITVRELEANAAAQLKAKIENDDAELLRLKAVQEEKEAQIEEVKVTVQEVAIAQSVNAPSVEVAQEVMPSVKVRRSSWVWEVFDIKETAKKMSDWTNITPNEEKIDDFLKAKKAEGITGEEFTVAGIKFYLKKTY